MSPSSSARVARFACCLLASALACIGLAVAADDSSSDTLAPIIVTASADASAQGVQPAYAGGQVARGGRVGIFGSMDIMTTPFSTTNYTQELIANQQAASVADVLQNDSAVRVARGFGNFQQVYIVRGLPIYSDDMSYNGLYGLLPRQYLAAELVERVEVLNGASAFLNGAAPGGSGLGGSVNVSPKRAPNQPVDDFTIGMESGSQKYLAADLARRYGPEENFGVRFNVVRRDGGTAVDGESRSLTAMALGLDFHVSGLRISSDIGYQNHQLDASQPSITPLAGIAIPAAPAASTDLSQPWAHSDERDVFGTLRAEYDINSVLTAWIAGGLRDGRESDTFANPSLLDDAGELSTYRFDNARRDLVDTGEIGIRAHFATGGVTQQWILSGAGYQLNSKNAYALSSFAGFTGSLYAPTSVPEPPANFFTGGELTRPLLTARTKTSSVALADQLGFLDDNVLVSIGARYQKIESYNYDYNSGDLTSSYGMGRVTPVVGFVTRFTSAFSLYGNYIEGLVQGPTAPDTYVNGSGATSLVVNAGQIFKPYATRQGEVGVKYDGGTLGGTLSVYYSSMPQGGIDIATGRFQIVDYQRNPGVELSWFGEPVQGVRVLGGLSWLEAAAAGTRPIGTPRWQANLGLETDIPSVHGLTLDARIVETSPQYADVANAQELPSWWRLDLGARYAFTLADGYKLTIRARAQNVVNRNQWVSVGGYPGSGYLVLGDPRTFIASATLSF